jgi:hypothetical protein
MDYKVAGDFSKAPLGAFTEANKKLVWPGLSYDADKGGTHYEIIEDSRFPGGRCCRLKYPKGGVGMQDQFYQIRIKSPGTITNLEWYWLFESDFVFYNPTPPQDVGGGKIGPCINVGEVGGEESKRGTRPMIWWNAQGSNHPKPVYSPSCQDQRTGNQLIQPVKYSKPIVLNALYKFRIKQWPAGDQGRTQYWVTYPGETVETLLADTGVKFMQVSPADDVIFDFAFFSGGAGDAYALPKDCYARHGGIRYWSGDAYWAADDTGNGGDGGTGNGGGTTPPTPPAGATSRYSLAVGETKIFRARFLDTALSPPQEIPAGAAVKWSLDPNLVSWGVEAGPNWSGIQVKGKTVGGPCVLIATDPSSGISTEPVNVDVTETPRLPGATTGVCTVEPLAQGERAGGRQAEDQFTDEPPQ